MKKIKRLTAAALCLALLLVLSACGSFEQKMVRAAAKMEKLESYHMDMDMEMGMSMSLLGQSVDMGMRMSSASDVNTEPFRMKSSMKLIMADDSMDMLSYVFAGDKEDSFDTYVSLDGGNTWKSDTVTAEELKGMNLRGVSVESLDYLRSCAESFNEVGREEINGSQATRYDGVIEGEAVARVVEASGVLDSVGGELGLDLKEVFNDVSGSIPVSLWIDDRSGMLVRYDMDMTEVFASVWDSVTAKLMDSEDFGGIAAFGLALELDKVSLSATLSAFNEVPEITLPDGVK